MTDTETAVFRVHIKGSIDDVWRELTRTDRPQQAMFNSYLHTNGIREGGRLRMRTKNGRYTSVVGDYIEVREPVRLAHTFRFTNYDDPECTVVYELAEVDGGVDFTLRVEGMPTGTKTAKQMTQGGEFITKTMKSLIETGRAPMSSRMLFVLFKLLEPMSPKRSRSEHWPL